MPKQELQLDQLIKALDSDIEKVQVNVWRSRGSQGFFEVKDHEELPISGETILGFLTNEVQAR